MFTLELDLVVTYIPPMSEMGGGIRLTREFQLPFPPYDGLQICGSFDQAPGPEGFVIKEVTWDVDRHVFLGEIKISNHDLPMEDIPLDLRAWIELGWRMGSYADNYEEPDYEDEEDEPTEEKDAGAGVSWVDEEYEKA